MKSAFNQTKEHEPLAIHSAALAPASDNATNESRVRHYKSHKEHAEQCPHCASNRWVRLHRSWWQKLWHKHQNLCICLQCQREFWKDR